MRVTPVLHRAAHFITRSVVDRKVQVAMLAIGAVAILYKISRPYKILIGSPIRQKPTILKEFLESLEKLDRSKCQFDCYFVDDNTETESTRLLNVFKKNHPEKCIIKNATSEENQMRYECDEVGHHWNEGTVWKVARFKDKIIQYAKEQGYDYLFLLDSDLVLHPRTVLQLIASGKDIISNVFWTKWTQKSEAVPQVWPYNVATMKGYKREIDAEDQTDTNEIPAFIKKMRKPGIHEVGGLGACTLLSRNALQRGVSFQKIEILRSNSKDLLSWSEDLHFCIRAAALGFKLFVETTLPTFHIFRESALKELPNYKRALV